MSALTADAQVDQYFIRGYGWRVYPVPGKLRWFVSQLRFIRQVSHVHIVGAGDYAVKELPSWDELAEPELPGLNKPEGTK